ncbi:MAG: hypothetical protein Q9174_001032 [Haloplaca sp. 1 TL-2023]
MVELRKRKEQPSNAPEQPPLKKSTSSASAKTATGSTKAASPSSNGADKTKKSLVGESIDLEGFGGEVETHDGVKTNLKKLLDESKNGVVLFTYPKASTPGCMTYRYTWFSPDFGSILLAGTTQVCLFRDEFTPLTATGYSIFGLSTDSPKSNTTFKTKQDLPYTLLCDPNATLIAAIGMKKAPKGTVRGVFVVSKAGIVEAAEPGGPAATVEVVRKLVEKAGGSTSSNVDATVKADGADEAQKDMEAEKADEPAALAASEETKTDGAQADVAAEVADTAEKLDGNTQ